MPPRSTLLLHTGSDIFIATLLCLFSGFDLLLWSTHPTQPPAAESSLLGSKIPQGKRQGINLWLYFKKRTSERYKRQNRNCNSSSSAFVLRCCTASFYRYLAVWERFRSFISKTARLCDDDEVYLFLPLILILGDLLPHHREKNYSSAEYWLRGEKIILSQDKISCNACGLQWENRKGETGHSSFCDTTESSCKQQVQTIRTNSWYIWVLQLQLVSGTISALPCQEGKMLLLFWLYRAMGSSSHLSPTGTGHWAKKPCSIRQTHCRLTISPSKPSPGEDSSKT